MYRSHISFLDVTSPLFGIPLASLSQVRNEYVFASSIVFWTAFLAFNFFQIFALSRHPLSVPRIWEELQDAIHRSGEVSLDVDSEQCIMAAIFYRQVIRVTKDGCINVTKIQRWENLQSTPFFLSFFCLQCIFVAICCPHILKVMTSELIPKWLRRPEMPMIKNRHKIGRQRWKKIQRRSQAFVWVIILGMPFLHLDTIHIHTNAKATIHLGLYQHLPTIYIYIWTVCWAMRTFRATDFRPRELCLPDNYVWKLLSLGSALTENAMKILYLVCYAAMFFLSNKKMFDRIWQNVFVGKTVVFHDFHDPLWLWLLEDAQTNEGEELCHRKHRCQVETTVLPVVAAVWNPPFGYLESERKFKVLVQMGFLVTKAEISACCMNLKGLLACFVRKTKLLYWNRMCRFFSEVVTLFFGDNLASKRW